MLGHGFHPMQPQTVQHRARAFHDAQDGDGEEEPHVEGDDGHDDGQDAGLLECVADSHVPQDDGQLLMCERQGPEPKIGRGV